MEAKFAQLQAEFVKTNSNHDAVAQHLQDFSMEMAKAGYFTTPGGLSRERQAMIREALEMGVFWSIYQWEGRGAQAFERYVTLLEPFYLDPLANETLGLQESPRMCCVLGLRLMYLLSTNQRARFHLLLARLPTTGTIPASPHVAFPVQLEQCLREGMYNRVAVARSQVPAPEFKLFVDRLMTAIRMDIAVSLERAATEIPERDLARLLLLGTEDAAGREQLEQAIVARKWTRNAATGTVVLASGAASTGSLQTTIDPVSVIRSTLTHAHELEQFV